MTDTDPQELYRDPDIDGCHHFRDPATCEECAQEKAHDRHIEYRVKMLDECVNDAERAVGNATANLRDLVSGDAWYIELAEGTEGSDALDDLAAAARLLPGRTPGIGRGRLPERGGSPPLPCPLPFHLLRRGAARRLSGHGRCRVGRGGGIPRRPRRARRWSGSWAAPPLHESAQAGDDGRQVVEHAVFGEVPGPRGVPARGAGRLTDAWAVQHTVDAFTVKGGGGGRANTINEGSVGGGREKGEGEENPAGNAGPWTFPQQPPPTLPQKLTSRRRGHTSKGCVHHRIACRCGERGEGVRMIEDQVKIFTPPSACPVVVVSTGTRALTRCRM